MTEQTVSTSQKRSFPACGSSAEEVRKVLDQRRAEITPLTKGKLQIHAFTGRPDIKAVVEEAFFKFFSINALLSYQEETAAAIENELLDMGVEIMSGGTEARANLTCGGTESNFCAFHAMREWAKTSKPQVTEPEVIAPYCGHSTFSKGAHYLGMKVKRVPVREDFHADAAAMAAAIGPNTVGIAASAPCWPYGLVDPIPELGQLALERDLWLHVDACVGGYILPFVRKAGYDIPPYDFSVPGVSSISADLHKYGYAAKPCSTIFWRSKELQRHHYVAVEDWPCGRYISQSFVGSRPFASIAAAWAVLKYLGEEGYVELAHEIMRVKAAITDAVAAIDGLSTWETHGPLLMIRGDDDVDIRLVVGGMKARGWRFFGVQEPPAIHLTVDPMPPAALQALQEDLRAVTAEVRDGASQNAGSLDYAGASPTDKAAATSLRWLIEAAEMLQDQEPA
jgi:glutamate/tyrosine decarboxylase-like PLP-dependent enzyme